MKDQKEEVPDDYDQPDRSHLSDLYPKAKTMEEQVADRGAKEDQRLARQPKHIVWSTSWRLYSVLVGLFVAIHGSVFLLGSFGVIAGVSFSFLLGLMWLGYVYWMYSSINRDFEGLTYTATPFLTLYTALYPIGMVLASQFVSPSADRLAFAAIATFAHFVYVYILMKLVGARA